MAKPMSAAEYAAHSEKARSDEKPQLVTLKSGARFLLRKPDLKAMIQLGVIPQALVNEMLKAMRARGSYTPPETPELQIDTLILQREVVAACCVMPPFNEQTAKSFLPADFEEIYAWAMGHQGVEGAEALSKFRKGRTRRTNGNRASRTQVRAETVSTAEN